MMKTINLNLITVIFIYLIKSAQSEFFEECQNLEDGTFIIGKQGCKSYIYCEGEESYEGFCPSQLLFNAIDGSCAPESEVDCLDDGAPTEAETEPPTTTSTTTTTTTTPSTTKATIEDPTTQAPPPAEVETVQPPVQPTNPPEPGKTTPSAFTITTSESVDVGPTSSPGQICPTSDDPYAVVLLPSETSCSEYFICYHGTPVRMVCSGQLLFDYVTLKCELPMRVHCKATIQTTPNPKTSCVRNTFDYFPYSKNCNYFYKCMNGYLSLQQCPIGFGWSDEMKLCLKLNNGRCPTRAAAGVDQLQNQSWLNNIYSVYMTSGRINSDGEDIRVYRTRTSKGFQIALIVLLLQSCSLSLARSEDECQFGTVKEDVNDCTQFFECSLDGKWEHSSCENGKKYDVNKETCVIDDYPPCKGPPTTTVSPGECLNEPCCEASEDGTFHRDKKDCRKYYVCKNGVATIMSCDIGFHFDETINACNYPALVQCNPKLAETTSAAPSTEPPTTSTITTTEASTSTAPQTTTASSSGTECAKDEPCCQASEDGTFHRDKKDCRKYYVCKNGVASLMSCDIGFHFDETINACNYPALVQCNPKPTETSSAAPSTEPPTTSTITTTEASTSTALQTTTASSPGTECSNDQPCCQASEHGTFHRDKKDCSKYYVCKNGVASILSCDTGFHFDETINACNYPALVQCNPKPTDTTSAAPSTEPPTTSTITTTEASTSTALQTTTASSPGTECSNDQPCCQASEHGTFHRDKKDCSKYYVCKNGLATILSCETGFHFDETINACNYPALVQCNPNPTETSSAAPSTEPPTTSTITTTEASTSTALQTTTASSSGTECANDEPCCQASEHGTFHRDKKDCGKYYMCKNGVVTLLTCETGFHFDETINSCNYPALVRCTSEPPTTSAVLTTETSGSQCPTVPNCQELPNGSYHRDKRDCRTFYVCSDGVAVALSCQKWQYFDDIAKSCNFESKVQCTTLDENCNAIPNCKVEPQFSFHRDRKDCRKYYVCKNNLAVPELCRNGEFFDTTINACQFSALVDCKPDEIVSAPIVVPEPIPRPIPSIMIPNGQVDPSIRDCMTLPEGTVFRHSVHCSVYYICRNGMAVKGSCPGYEWFNDEIKTCNYKYLVSCGSGMD
ncbi:uncharacterized protein LOC129951656 [Eupeodes corollae]|uniref:uncharacterized protein LOC129951656 n=1 Tax=Eupeodes corollae TaxID=290404 RepID=UPI00249370EE|nr:uncharacterized protein LOC129951656 [Eupeodes corollae]